MTCYCSNHFYLISTTHFQDELHDQASCLDVCMLYLYFNLTKTKTELKPCGHIFTVRISVSTVLDTVKSPNCKQQRRQQNPQVLTVNEMFFVSFAVYLKLT